MYELPCSVIDWREFSICTIWKLPEIAWIPALKFKSYWGDVTILNPDWWKAIKAILSTLCSDMLGRGGHLHALTLEMPFIRPPLARAWSFLHVFSFFRLVAASGDTLPLQLLHYQSLSPMPCCDISAPYPETIEGEQGNGPCRFISGSSPKDFIHSNVYM